MLKSLKTNTNRMTKEENEARNSVGVDHGPSLLDLGTSTQPPSRLFIGNEGI